MPYPQDLVGKFINFKIPSGRPTRQPANLVNGVLPNQITHHTVQVYDQVPAPRSWNDLAALPITTNASWQFPFLSWVAGNVTTASLPGTGMVTGPMSGCYICKYNHAGWNMAHIGTDVSEKKSLEAKRSWNEFVAHRLVNNVTGASPFKSFTIDELRRTLVFAPPVVLCYMDATAAYALLVCQLRRGSEHNKSGLELMNVIDIKQMTLQPWAAIGANARFAVGPHPTIRIRAPRR